MVAFLALPKRPRNVWALVDSVGAAAIGWKPEQFSDPTAQKTPYIDPQLIATADSLERLAERIRDSIRGYSGNVSKI